MDIQVKSGSIQEAKADALIVNLFEGVDTLRAAGATGAIDQALGGAIGELFELAKITNKFCDDADLEGKGKGDAAAVAKFTTLLTTLRELTNILGIFVASAKPQAAGGDDLLAKVMPLVIEVRATARKIKNFAVADKIRDALGPIGVTLEDRAGGTEWTKS